MHRNQQNRQNYPHYSLSCISKLRLQETVKHVLTEMLKKNSKLPNYLGMKTNIIIKI